MTQTSGASRRGNAKLCPVVIARSTPVRRSPAFGRRRVRRSNPAFRFLGPKAGLLTWGMCVSRMSSHLFVRLRPPLRPDRGLCRMARADQVKAGPLGPPRSGLGLELSEHAIMLGRSGTIGAPGVGGSVRASAILALAIQGSSRFGDLGGLPDQTHILSY